MPSPLPLAPGEAHLWYAVPDELRDAALISRYRTWLAPGERERLERFRFEKHRHEYLCTRALVRSTLSRYAPVAPAEWSFGANRYGCPYIAGPPVLPRLRFNLSNTLGLVACLVALDVDIGVDVEATERPGETVQLADRFFSPTEVVELRSLPPERQRGRFFDYWTLKESYIKARGMGLAIPLDQFSFHLTPGQPVRISFDPQLQDDPASWQFLQQQPLPDHKAAVAIRRGAGKPDFTVTTRWVVPGES